MKIDYSFKLVVAIVVAGVLVALVSPSHAVNDTQASTVDSVQVANHSE